MHEAPVFKQACISVSQNEVTQDSRRKATYVDQIVILRKVGLIECACSLILSQELPADGETEGIESKVIDEVLHLAFTVMAVILQERRIGALGGAALPGLINIKQMERSNISYPITVAAKVESSNVHSDMRELAGGSVGQAGGTSRRRSSGRGSHGSR